MENNNYYITFQQAQKMRTLDYPQEAICSYVYTLCGNTKGAAPTMFQDDLPCITIDEAAKWFRENKGYAITIDITKSKRYQARVVKLSTITTCMLYESVTYELVMKPCIDFILDVLLKDKELKQTDLMLGDIIRNKNYPNQMFQIYHPNQIVDTTNYEPVPITNDFLSLNGWNSSGDFSSYSLSSVESLIYDDKMCQLRLMKSDNNSLHEDNTVDLKNEYCCRCYYIHELQHALRLFGLNYLADNLEF